MAGPPEGESFDVEQIRRNPFMMGLAALPVALVPVLWTLAIASGQPAFAFPTIHLAVIGALAMFWTWRRNPLKRKKLVRVAVDDAITVGEQRVERKKLTRGVIVPRDGKIEVHLAKPGPDLELVVESPDVARKLLSSLGFDADQSVAMFRAMSLTLSSIPRTMLTMFACIVPMMLLTFAGAIISPAIAPVTFVLGIGAMMTLMFAPARVEVGADGVLIRWLGTQRFVSHGDISDVQTIVAGFGRNRRIVVNIILTSQQAVTLPMTGVRFDDGRAAGLATRILEAREVYRRGGADENAFLLRGDRPHTKWITALRAREVVGHRDAAPPNELLWRVIEDAAAEPIERAAAAVALGRELGEPDRERLTRAAKATAAPKLRVVLDSVADVEEEVLAERLAAIEAGDRKKKKR